MRQRRTLNLGGLLTGALVLVIGALVLLGFFLRGGFEGLLGLLSDWVVLLVAFALLVGLGNVLRVHGGRILRGASTGERLNSAVLVGSALIVLLIGLYEGTPGGGETGITPWIFTWIYSPLGASLFALLAFFVLSAAFRTLRAGPSAAWLVLGVALLVIIGAAPWSQVAPFTPLADLYNWIVTVPAMAGIRGILLGAALGAIATSLRVLLGFDRPYTSSQ
jgi:hypothetical protein